MLTRVRRLSSTLLPALSLAAAAALGVPTAQAHPLTFTEVTLTLGPGQVFVADVIYDLDALALGAPIDTDDAELAAALAALGPDELEVRLGRLRRLFERRVRVRFDGEPVPFEVGFPDHGAPWTAAADIPTVLGLTARLTGAVPPDAAAVGFFASRAFGEVHLSIVDAVRGGETRSILEPGARSEPLNLSAPFTPPGPGETAGRYLRLGFVHILPAGADHILFVLALFLLSTRLRPLVWQVTAFTVAHAVTLTLATLDVVALAPRIVEPLIALSVAGVAVENVLTDRLTRWRPAVVFGFGLLHGLGFAGVLGELGLPDEGRLLALAAFNAGIELGQLAVIAGAVAALGWCRRKPWYRGRVSVPLSCAIALTGFAWAVERTVGG